MTNTKKIVLYLFILGAIAIPNKSFAAKIYFNPGAGQYNLGDEFVVDIKIDTQGECINAAQIDISFPNDLINSIDFSNGESIFTLWPERQKISQEEGKVSFSGGVPGGYCGKIIGDSGPSDIIGKLIIRLSNLAISQKNGEIKFLDSSKVLLNDGLGTIANLTKDNFFFSISDKKVDKASNNTWAQNIQNDITPPEKFDIEIIKDDLLFDGKYFIIFSTVDKQTGIQEYFVKEGDSDWQKANSPYLLTDQTLSSKIRVKAVDKAGNERISDYNPKQKFTFSALITIIICLGLLFLFIFLIKKIINKRR